MPRRMEGPDDCPNGHGIVARMGGAKQPAARYRQNQRAASFVYVEKRTTNYWQQLNCSRKFGTITEGAERCTGALDNGYGRGGSPPDRSGSRDPAGGIPSW